MMGGRTEYSRARRLARWLVWAAFGVVAGYRVFVFEPPPPPPPRVGGGGGGGEFMARMQDRGGWEGRRWERRRTRVEPPQAAVPPDLPRLQIEVGPRDMEVLRGHYWSRGDGGSSGRPQVLAVVREGGVIYSNVALQLKGAAGSFRPVDDKPAFTLNFSKHVQGRRFHGMTKLSLNNSVQDPSYLAEAISRDLFQRAGVPVPGASHATVLLNGRDLGLYVMVEGYSKDFLRRHFSNVKGNLYDGGFCQDISSELEVDSGDRPEDHADLQALVDACFERDLTNRWQRIEAVLDVDRFASMLAMEILTCHWDGYALNRNNYRVFHDRATERLVFMPHGMDQMFGTFRSSPQSPILPGMQGLVAHAFMTTVPGFQKYMARLTALHKDLFKEAELTNRVGQLAARVRPTLAAYDPGRATLFDSEVADMMTRLGERCRSVAEQLAAPREPLLFESGPVEKLTGWFPRAQIPGGGTARLTREERDGVKLLTVGAHVRTASASWRARALVMPGRYQFEGRVRVEEAEGGEVTMRIAGYRPPPQRPAVGEWLALAFPFEVREPMMELEFICEFRAEAGVAGFDEASLVLRRL